ncbi:hypothetical protein AAAV70_30015 [Hungatella hathewayi]|uniref:hypothetical protein n=1 Tax=Hungatella hathewayi TaxID=154046 RepID=UPI0032C12719
MGQIIIKCTSDKVYGYLKKYWENDYRITVGITEKDCYILTHPNPCMRKVFILGIVNPRITHAILYDKAIFLYGSVEKIPLGSISPDNPRRVTEPVIVEGDKEHLYDFMLDNKFKMGRIIIH